MPDRRRFLFVAPPGYGHLFPVVPLARALLEAGHDVRVATCGVSLSAASRAGLPVANVAKGVDLPAIYHRHRSGFRDSFRGTAGNPDDGDAERPIFAELGERMIDGVLELARIWRPNAIVHTPDAAAAPLAATVLSLPTVFLGLGLAHTPGLALETTYRRMTEACERLATVHIAPPALWIDVAPPSLVTGRARGTPMQYVPYNGPEVPSGNLSAPGRRPRIAVTLGTVVPMLTGLAPLRQLALAARDIDADFIVAHGTAAPSELGALPPNVCAVPWVPWDQLVSTCSAAIHHAGSGTTLCVLRAGLPQILIPQGSDQFYNAAALVGRGAGIQSDGADLNRDALTRLLHDAGLHAAARGIGAEMSRMPPPAAVVSQLVAVA